MADSCLFCSIVEGSIPSDRVLETDDVLAFRDISPTAPTHVLVIPKTHVANATELDGDSGPLLANLFSAANRVAAREGIAESGYRLVFNVGDDAGNMVPHLHLHVIGGRKLEWPPG